MFQLIQISQNSSQAYDLVMKGLLLYILLDTYQPMRIARNPSVFDKFQDEASECWKKSLNYTPRNKNTQSLRQLTAPCSICCWIKRTSENDTHFVTQFIHAFSTWHLKYIAILSFHSKGIALTLVKLTRRVWMIRINEVRSIFSRDAPATG